MRYGKLSELAILLEKEGQGKLNTIEYTEIIMNGEMLNFWMKGMEDVGYLMMMKDSASYHKGATTLRGNEYEQMGWISWGLGTWPSNSPDLNPIENLRHILRSNIRKGKCQPRNRNELIMALQEE